jgi:hypothetical protein
MAARTYDACLGRLKEALAYPRVCGTRAGPRWRIRWSFVLTSKVKGSQMYMNMFLNNIRANRIAVPALL